MRWEIKVRILIGDIIMNIQKQVCMNEVIFAHFWYFIDKKQK